MDGKRNIIYTDVPEEVQAWVEEQARRLMISKAAVVRQILAREVYRAEQQSTQEEHNAIPA